MRKAIHNTIKKVKTGTVPIHYIIALLFIFCLGCSKSEEAIEQPRFTLVALNAITVDSLRLSVTENGELLTDSLMTPQGKASTIVKYQDPLRRYKVTDLYTNTVLFDSTIRYQKLYSNPVTFFQPVSGGRLILVSPPVNEPAPHIDSLKLSIVYSALSTAALYDQIKVVVEQSKDGGPTYVPRDSFLLKRGEFSSFITGAKTRRPILKLYSTDANRVQLGATYNGMFSEAGDFSIYYLRLQSSTSTDFTKLY